MNALYNRDLKNFVQQVYVQTWNLNCIHTFTLPDRQIFFISHFKLEACCYKVENVMDIFKLLAKSTNLQKSASTSRKATHQRIPSAGLQSHRDPSIHTEIITDAEKHSLRTGTKRKRSEGKSEQTHEISDRPNRFRPGNKDDVSHEKPSSPASNSLRPTPQAKGEVIGGEILHLDEDECRRVMKRNKLKITLLDVPAGVENELSDSASSKSHTGLSKQLVVQPLVSFQQLRTKYGISKRLVENLKSQGYYEPTGVQMGSLPVLLGTDEDRGVSEKQRLSKKRHNRSGVDLLTVAPTGSGKTLAFILAVFHGLLKDMATNTKEGLQKAREHNVQALIIAPTHELADQIANEGKSLATGTGLRIANMRKGMRLNSQKQTIDKDVAHKDVSDGELSDLDLRSTQESLVKVDVLVSTPLMLLHAISPDSTSAASTLPAIRYLVLDEADILLDPLFRFQTLGIWDACVNPSLQTSLWSATIGSSIETLAQSFILGRRRTLNTSKSQKQPHYILRLIVGLKDSAVPNISHRLVYTANEQGKLLAMRQLIHPAAGSADGGLTIQPPFLVFTQTIPRAIALHSELLYDIPSEAGGSSRIAVLHADLSGPARSAIMADFRRGDVWVLITTDLLSRGVDFRGLNGVVNYDIPNTSVSYVHRVGRTGRQGREGGIAVTFYTKEDIPYVKNVANVISASEKMCGKTGGANDAKGVQKWLLDALPAVSKKTKQELKRKGVESRRVVAAKGTGEAARAAKKTRISTKSGYDRKLENRRKGAAVGSRRRAREEGSGIMDDSGAEEWGGIDD